MELHEAEWTITHQWAVADAVWIQSQYHATLVTIAVMQSPTAAADIQFNRKSFGIWTTTSLDAFRC